MAQAVVDSLPMGPRSLEECFRWPERLVESLRGSLSLDCCCCLFDQGVNLISHYSGQGSDHAALHYLAHAIGRCDKLASTHSADIDPTCRLVVNSLEDSDGNDLSSQLVFGDFHDLLPRARKERLAKAMSSTATGHGRSDIVASNLAAVANEFETARKNGMLFSLFAPCSRHKGDGCKPFEHDTGAMFNLAIAGSTCTDSSSVGKRRGLSGESSSAFLCWVFEMRTRRPTMIIHECTALWKPELLTYFLGDTYSLIFRKVLSPHLIGWPVKRPRHYSVLLLKECGIVYYGSEANFLETLGCQSVVGADCMWCAHDGLVSRELSDMRKIFRSDDCHDIGLEQLLPPGAAHRYSEYMKSFANTGGAKQPVYVFDCEQNPDASPHAPSKHIPTLLTHGTLCCTAMGRPLVAEEHLVCQGIPCVPEAVGDMHGYPLRCLYQSVLGNGTLSVMANKRIAGNSIHVAVIGSLVGYIFGHLLLPVKPPPSMGGAALDESETCTQEGSDN